MTPVRVAFFTPGFHLGGAERWIVSLCREFDRKIVTPTMIAVGEWNNISPVMRAAMPKDVAILPATALEGQWPLFADTVIGWGAIPFEIPKREGLRVLSCLHHAGKACYFTKKANAMAIQAGAELYGVNAACRATLPEPLPEPLRERMTVMPNGADEARVTSPLTQEQAKGAIGIDPQTKFVAYIGRVMPDKNIGAIAKAVGLLPGWLLLVCGPTLSHHRPDFAGWTRAAQGRLIYLAARDHVGDVLRAADVFALLSPSEAHPLSVTEAWLAGVPVVCTDLPWIRSLEATHGPMGAKVNPRHDPREVAEAILMAAASDPREIEAIARQHFTAAAMGAGDRVGACGGSGTNGFQLAP